MGCHLLAIESTPQDDIASAHHDDDGSLTGSLALRAGEGATGVAWREISSRQQLYGVHLALLYKVAEMHNAAF